MTWQGAARGCVCGVARSADMKASATLARFMLAALIVIVAGPALAHSAGETGGSGVLSGMAHPISGWDHVAAMVAVGLWGAFLGMPAIWLMPVAFPMVMALGGAMGVVGVPPPGVETGIALSAVVLGACIALALHLPLAVAVGIVGVFAIFHGHAHGTELPASANPVAYAVGFVLATGLLHLAGIGFGLVVRWPAGRIAVRAAGAVIAFAGLAFLAGVA